MKGSIITLKKETQKRKRGITGKNILISIKLKVFTKQSRNKFENSLAIKNMILIILVAEEI